MTLNLDALKDSPRLLIEARLKPVQGMRFQPTGFPEIGAAEYDGPDGEKMLLVESAQSMANRLEAVCWDSVKDNFVEPLTNLPYINILDGGGGFLTSSVLDSHRLNSNYVMESSNGIVPEMLHEELKELDGRSIDLRKAAAAILKYDIGSIIHGVFLVKQGYKKWENLKEGRIRLPRIVSAFIEAEDIKIASSGGAKLDHINPSQKDGKGNVIYSKDEYVSPKITAYFNIDLAQLRGYGFSDTVTELLIVLSLFKVRRFLECGLRLRTACDLDVDMITVTRPDGFEIPETADLEKALPDLIAAANREGVFADPVITEVTYRK